MTDHLTGEELCRLVARVFEPGPRDRSLAIISDLPDARTADNPLWHARRKLARDWARLLRQRKHDLALDDIDLAWYQNSGSNNADLPPTCVYDQGLSLPDGVADIAGWAETSFADLFQSHTILLAPTEFSTTAPLKVAARNFPFRAATMPGFTSSMIPALRIDYTEVNRRVHILKDLLDRAETAHIALRSPTRRHLLKLDLRHRVAHASGGLLPENGVAGNLPSGEAYVVPYEGEIPNDRSGSAGELPVQIGQEVVIYRIEANRAVDILSRGPESEVERLRIQAEPAYANLAELGLGVLGDFGLKPAGIILLDEKLGLHLAFGRSDHFGGAVGPDAFSSPEAVIHLDRVYIPETQPRITVEEVRLDDEKGSHIIMKDNQYQPLF
jgi:aminopeptidase